MTKLTLLALAALASIAVAHPGEIHIEPSNADLQRRMDAADRRRSSAGKCASQIDAMNAARLAKRSARQRVKRNFPTSVLSAPAPRFTTLQNTSCVLSPSLTEGPYYISNELVRRNLTEGQAGVPLTLDIGLIDTTTCQPFPNAYIELWQANATGQYSGFAARSKVDGSERNQTGGIPVGGGNTVMTDVDTFLRGGWPTDSNGIVEFETLMPGIYTGRTVHIHMMVHTNYTIADNGTIISDTGSVQNIGQLFFDEDLMDSILLTPLYNDTTAIRTRNAEDFILRGNFDGSFAFVDIDFLGDGLDDGLSGYATVGVDSTASISFPSTNYASVIAPEIGAAALAALTGGSALPAATSGQASGAPSSTRASSVAAGQASTSAAPSARPSGSGDKVRSSITGLLVAIGALVAY